MSTPKDLSFPPELSKIIQVCNACARSNGNCPEHQLKSFAPVTDSLVPQDDEQVSGHTPVTPEDSKPAETNTADRNYSSGWQVGERYKVGYQLSLGVAEFDVRCLAIHDNTVTCRSQGHEATILNLKYANIIRRQVFVRYEPVWREA